MLLKHNSGRFPAGYIYVRVQGECVFGVYPNGDEQLTGWTVDEAHNFKIDGRWVEVSQ